LTRDLLQTLPSAVARLYFDHNISRQLGPELLALGHDTLHSQECGMGRAADAQHLLHAVHEQRIIVTNDTDFKALQAAWLLWPIAWSVSSPPAHHGILWIREGQMGGADRAAQIIHEHLTSSPELANHLWCWERPKGWHEPQTH